MTLSVLSVSSEAVPLIKTGGLADVAGALPAALAPHGVEMITLLPGYNAVRDTIGRPAVLHEWPDLLGEKARLLAGTLGGHGLLILDAPTLYTRDGGPYGDPSGKSWDDNWRRFAAFGRAAADIAGGAIKGERFDLLHAHDWQAAMAAAYMRFAPYGGGDSPIPSVMTIHNMAFQGNFSAEIFPFLGLPDAAWSIDGVECYGGVGFLKAGLQAASAITTVSPGYAREIRSAEFGMGLEGLIQAKGDRVTGILNGIDTVQWNPTTDQNLAANFTAQSLERRIANRYAVEAEFRLDSEEHPKGPLFIIISRLTWQKGMDILPGAVEHLVASGSRLAVLGTGDKELEDGFRAIAERYPGRIGVRIGYDEGLSHLMQAGGDAILIPSRFEPCGLTQLYGLAYGCVPVVSRTGGLADTVIDANPAALATGAATGIQANSVTLPSLISAIDRAVALFRQPDVWRQIQRSGMACDFSWSASGKAYAALYEKLAAEAISG